MFQKVKPHMFQSAMDTLIVICQRQTFDHFPLKTLRRLIKRREELNLISYFQSAQEETDLAGFLRPFWSTLLTIYNQGVEDEDFSDLIALCDVTTVSSKLSSRQATDLMTLVVESMIHDEKVKMPKTLQRNLKSVILRFGPEFDALRTKYKKKHDKTVAALIEQCQIQPHEIGDLDVERKRKRRRRASSTKSNEDVKDVKDEEINGFSVSFSINFLSFLYSLFSAQGTN